MRDCINIKHICFGKGSKLTYMIDGKLFERKKVSENEIFPTQEEAETRCNELNKEVTANGNR